MCDKAFFRVQIRKARRKTEKDALHKDSYAVFCNLKQYMENLCFSTVFCYLSYSAEVETEPILQYLYGAGKKVFVPVVEGKMMFAAEWTPGLAMEKNIFGIPEPASKVFYPGKIDLAIVPGMAFDRQGKRLGQGGGYYDRWLAGQDIFRIGICFSWQVMDSLPAEDTDIPMDVVIAENGIVWG